MWTSFEHVQPLKRSEGSLLDSVSDPLFQNKVSGLNMSNTPANYPINLMYANNLTVKNYFLMMPQCNGSSGGIPAEQLQRLDEGSESSDKPEFSVKPLHQSTSGVNESHSYTKETQESAKGTVTSTASASYNPNENTKETILSLNGLSSKDHNPATTPSVGSVSSSSETVTSTDHIKTESTTKLGEEISKTTTKNLVSFILMTNDKNEEHRLETTSSKHMLGETIVTGNHSTSTSTQQETSASLNTSKPSTPCSSNPTTTQPQNTITTLDAKASKFLQTVDKYCETFSWSDKEATYTIHPVTFGQHENVDNILPGKSSYKGKLSSLKDKRFLVQKIPRKNFKQILTDQLDYPL